MFPEKVFVLHRYDWIHWMAKSCTTTAYRWLLRDSLTSLRTLWSAVIKSPKCSALGTTAPVRLLQEALVIFVFKQISQFGSFGKCLYTLCLPELGSTFGRGSIGSSWGELAVSRSFGSGFRRGFVGPSSSTKFSLKSCSQSVKSCNRSLCTSSRPSFLFLFLVVDPCSGFHQKLSIRTSTSFWHWIFKISVFSVRRCWLLWRRWWRGSWRCRWGRTRR